MSQDSFGGQEKLKSTISQVYTLDDIESICFDLGLNYEELPGDRLSRKVESLLVACYKTGKLAQLNAYLRKSRPEENWLTVEELEAIDWESLATQVDFSGVVVGEGGEFVGRDKILNLNFQALPVVLVLLVLVAVLSYFLLRPSSPEVMEADFTIAVAEFVVLDTEGRQINSEEGVRFSAWLYRRLDNGVSEILDELFDGSHLLWPPEYTGRVEGATAELRAKNAEALSNKIGADLIIYGVISPFDEDQIAKLEFFVNHTSFDEGVDIQGGYEIGDSLVLSNPFDGSLINVNNPPLSVRANGIGLIAIGLAYYSIDAYDASIEYFKIADEELGWLDSISTGKHVVKLLLGNSYARQASALGMTDQLELAQSYFNASLQINENYARAAVGRAGVSYLQALGDPFGGGGVKDIDLALLDAAEGEYEAALLLEDALQSANIQPKVDLGLGQIYFMKLNLGQGEMFKAQAVEKFSAVIAAFESGNNQIEEYAAQAYARLGLIEDVLEENPTEAIRLYRLAVEHSPPAYQVDYQLRVGTILSSECDLDGAIEAFEEAQRFALRNGDQVGLDKASELLNNPPDCK